MRGRVKRLGQGVDELLDGNQVLLVATAEVLQENTRKGVRVFLTSKALILIQGEWVSPSYLSVWAQLSGGRLRGAFYSTCPGGQACRAPQLLTRPRIVIGSPRSGWWLLHSAKSRIPIGCCAGQSPARGRRGSGGCHGWLRRPRGRGSWLRRRKRPARERPLQAPREVPQSWLRWFRCGDRCGEPSGRGLGWLGMVHVDRAPYQAILVRHLIQVGHPFYYKGSLPLWSQLISTLGRSCHREDEASLAIWVSSNWSWRWGHLLVGESEALLHCLHI